MLEINKYTQFFTVTSPITSKLIFQLRKFNDELVTYKMGIKRTNKYSPPETIQVKDKEFFYVEEPTETMPDKPYLIRYPITIYDKFIEFLENNEFDLNGIDIKNHEAFSGRTIDVESNPKYTPRDYQEEYIRRIVGTDKNNILIDLDTGLGKTFISMNAVSRMKKAFSMVVLPRYIDKWIGDILELTNIKLEEIMVVQGMDNMAALLNADKEQLKGYKAFIFSLTTMNYFIKYYTNGELAQYTDKKPDDLFEHIGTEIVLNDETHQEFYNVYKFNLFNKARLFIGITATLVNNDETLMRLYKIMFPDEQRASNIVEYKPYINVISIRYKFRAPKRLRFKNNFGYNQPMFENSIKKTPMVLNNYLNMIDKLLKMFYYTRRKPGEKILIFMGTVNMCATMVEYLKPLYKKFVINKYTEEEDYSILAGTDIIVSTIPSSGTALDIPNLITVIQTVNTNSIGANMQTLGRLRKLKDREVYFLYTWSSDIKPHSIYNINRLKLFSKRAKEIKAVEYRELL